MTTPVLISRNSSLYLQLRKIHGSIELSTFFMTFYYLE